MERGANGIVNEARDIEKNASWILLPPGDRALLRFAAPAIPENEKITLATAGDLLAANMGRPFPWGNMPNGEDASLLWKNYMIGYGGLYHDQWFITAQGRFGGAANVPRTLPGSLRSCLHYDGGQSHSKAGNEGYALIRTVADENRDLYRAVQMHAAEHVSADGGHIIVSPLDWDNGPESGVAYVGFVGRCQTCPNPEMISFRQLQTAVPAYSFALLPEWRNWSLTPRNACGAAERAA